MELLQELEEWGCDIEGAMDRFLEDETLYISCLEKVCREPAFERLREELQKGNAQAAFEHAHCLKGVFANLGLEPMLAIVVRIVEPLRIGETENLLPIYGELLVARAKLCEILRSGTER